MGHFTEVIICFVVVLFVALAIIGFFGTFLPDMFGEITSFFTDIFNPG